jgi:excisionase family DNA binding protein
MTMPAEGAPFSVRLEASPAGSPYLVVAEAAVYLRTSVQGVYSLVKRGKIKPMPGRPGRLLFTRETLDRYLGGKFRR